MQTLMTPIKDPGIYILLLQPAIEYEILQRINTPKLFFPELNKITHPYPDTKEQRINIISIQKTKLKKKRN